MKAVDVQNTLNIVTSYNINDNSENAADKVSGKMFEGLSKLYPNMDKEKFLKMTDDRLDLIGTLSQLSYSPVQKFIFYLPSFLSHQTLLLLQA